VAVRSGQDQGRPAHGRGRPDRRLDRVPFRRKLDALVLLPSIAIIALLTPLVAQQVRSARGWQDAASYMNATEQVSALINDLGTEQEDALGVIGSIQLVNLDEFDKAAAKTDQQKVAVLAAFGNNPDLQMRNALAEVTALSKPRDGVRSGAVDGSSLLQSYTSAMQDLNAAMGLGQRAATPEAPAVPAAELNILFLADLAGNEREAALTEIADNPSQAKVQYPLALQDEGVAIEEGARLKQFIPAAD
jgi:hypothetical protein